MVVILTYSDTGALVSHSRHKGCFQAKRQSMTPFGGLADEAPALSRSFTFATVTRRFTTYERSKS